MDIFYTQREREKIVEDISYKNPRLGYVLKRTKNFVKNHYNTAHYFFEFLYTLLEEIIHKDHKVFLACPRGSYSRLNPSPHDDLDILLITSKPVSLSYGKLGFDYKESKIQRLIKEVKRKMETHYPNFTNIEISVFIPLVPKNPKDVLWQFSHEPAELEKRTYHSQFPRKNKKTNNYLNYVSNYLEIMNRYMNEINGITKVERIRSRDYKDFGITEEDAHGVSIITDARICGVCFSNENINQPPDVVLKNKLLKDLYPETFDKINGLVR